jgi:hypothetical protein
MPYVLGKKSGKTTIDVMSKSCNPKLTFEWGTYHLDAGVIRDSSFTSSPHLTPVGPAIHSGIAYTATARADVA